MHTTIRRTRLSVSAAALTGLAWVTTGAVAQEVGRVISSTPLIQQVSVPRQVCTTQPTVVSEHKSGAGAMMGALAGGGLGNSVGQGSGKALATMVGVMGGAIFGNSIEGGGQQVQNVQTCTTQTLLENRAVGYNVVYEYGGKQYTVQMPSDPGPTIQLQVSPVGANSGSVSSGTGLGDVQPIASYPPQNSVVTTQTYVQPYVQPQFVAQPVYTAPYTTPIYARPRYVVPQYLPYNPPIGLTLGLGFRSIQHGGHHGHHHNDHHGWDRR